MMLKTPPHVRARNERWRSENRDRDNELARIRYAKAAEEKNERRRVLYAENQARVREQVRVRRARRRAVVSRFKMLKGCVSCGTTTEASGLDFHHREPELKSFNISESLFHRSWDAIKREIAKCDVVCRSCHADVHRKPTG